MKQLVKINRKIKDKPCDLYSPDDTFLGQIKTILELEDIKIQIKRKSLVGYYVIFYNQRIDITPDGKMTHWPVGFFEIFDDQMRELLS